MSHTEIKTFEDACTKLAINPEEFKITYPDSLGESFGKALVAHSKLVIIAKALNGDWLPDWKNGKFDKYLAWFDMDDPSAVGGFSYDVFVLAYSYSFVGSRLYYKSSEIAKYAGKQFIDLYREYMVIQ